MPVLVRRIASALLVVSVLAAGGCSLRGTGYQYVRNRETGTYLKLPESWDVAAPESGGTVEFGRLFDARAVDPPILLGDRPSGIVRVRTLDPSERYEVSFATMRKELEIDIDGALDAGIAEVNHFADLRLPGGFRGERIDFTITEHGKDALPPVRISQTAVVDASTTRVYLLAVGCQLPCFERHAREIDTIVESLTLKET